MPERRTRRWWRKQYVASHYAKRKVAAGLIREQMKTKRYTVTTLTNEVNRALDRAGAIRTKPVTRQAISLIVNDKMDACKPDLAAAIEEALEVPNLLFSLHAKSSDTRKITKQDAAA